MKTLMTFMLSMMILCQSALASNSENFEQMLKELEYSLTVEWDQKDKKYYEQAMERFYREMSELQKRGLSNREMLSVIERTSLNTKVVSEMKHLIGQLDVEKLSLEETKNLVMKAFREGQAKGGNWMMSDVVILASFFAIVGVAVLLIVDYLKKEKAKCEANPASCQPTGSPIDDIYAIEDDYSCEYVDTCEYYPDGTYYCYTTSYCY